MQALSDPTHLLWYISVFAFVFGVITLIHEAGHFLVARYFGINVEIFSLGLGRPIIAWTSKAGIEYRLCWLLFVGGFVRFGDPANVVPKGVPFEKTFRGAPLLQRFFVIFAGPAANIITAALLFFVLAFNQGVPTDYPIIKSIKSSPFDYDAFRVGDVITGVNGIDLGPKQDLRDVLDELPTDEIFTYKILRDGEAIAVSGGYLMPPVIDSLAVDGVARLKGMRVNDVITAVDGQPVWSLKQVSDYLEQIEDTEITLDVWRPATQDGAKPDQFKMTMTAMQRDLPDGEGGFEQRYVIGITTGFFFEPEMRDVGALEAAGLGLIASYRIAVMGLNGFIQVMKGSISACNIAGPISIASASVTFAEDGLVPYLLFIGMLSIAVAIFNLFPIPILDGGHLMFLAYEWATGAEPNPGVMRMMSLIGITLVLSLLVTSVSSDFLC